MTGGLGPSPLVTLNVSVKHCVTAVTETVPPGATTPDLAMRLATTTASLLGPVMLNTPKSSLSWQILSLQGHIVATQEPAVGEVLSK